MTDNIRQFIDPSKMAEQKKIVDAKMQGWEKGYDKGYEVGFRFGSLAGVVVTVGLYMLVQLAGKVL